MSVKLKRKGYILKKVLCDEYYAGILDSMHLPIFCTKDELLYGEGCLFHSITSAKNALEKLSSENNIPMKVLKYEQQISLLEVQDETHI